LARLFGWVVLVAHLAAGHAVKVCLNSAVGIIGKLAADLCPDSKESAKKPKNPLALRGAKGHVFKLLRHDSDAVRGMSKPN
jgi:hypothetical protein